MFNRRPRSSAVDDGGSPAVRSGVTKTAKGTTTATSPRYGWPSKRALRQPRSREVSVASFIGIWVCLVATVLPAGLIFWATSGASGRGAGGVRPSHVRKSEPTKTATKKGAKALVDSEVSMDDTSLQGRIREMFQACQSLGEYKDDFSSVKGLQEDMESMLTSRFQTENAGDAQSLRSWISVREKGSSMTLEWQTKKQHDPVVVYNPLDVPRSFCRGQQTVQPHSFQVVSSYDECFHDPFQISSQILPSVDDGIDVGFGSSNRLAKPSRDWSKECPLPSPTAHCHKYGRGGITNTVNIIDTPWSFKHTMEGPQYYASYRVRPEDYQRNNFYATTSFESEVPLPYYSAAEYNIHKTPPVQYDKVIKGTSFLARNCGSRNNRERWVSGLQDYFRVDSLSSCLHNAEPPNGMSLIDKVAVMREYLFHLSFENQCEDDYITEKLWGAYEAGVVPVYFGAPNVKEHAPPNSLIVVQDFDDDIQALGEYLTKVSNDRTLYESFQAWRKSSVLPESFLTKYAFTNIHSECRFCKWAYARKHGLPWDHDHQEVQFAGSRESYHENASDETMLEFRRPCVDDSTKLLLNPFQESFGIVGSEQTNVATNKRARNSCNELTATSANLEEGPYQIRRHIVPSEQHDFVDLHVVYQLVEQSKSPPPPLVLSIGTIVKGGAKTGVYASASDEDDGFMRKHQPSRGAARSWRLSVEDELIRATIVSDTPIQMTVVGAEDDEGGTVRVQLALDSEGNSRRKIRFMVEGIDTLRRSKEEKNTPGSIQPTFFCQSLTEDFRSPLELFYKQ